MTQLINLYASIIVLDRFKCAVLCTLLVPYICCRNVIYMHRHLFILSVYISNVTVYCTIDSTHFNRNVSSFLAMLSNIIATTCIVSIKKMSVPYASLLLFSFTIYFAWFCYLFENHNEKNSMNKNSLTQNV